MNLQQIPTTHCILRYLCAPSEISITAQMFQNAGAHFLPTYAQLFLATSISILSGSPHCCSLLPCTTPCSRCARLLLRWCRCTPPSTRSACSDQCTSNRDTQRSVSHSSISRPVLCSDCSAHCGCVNPTASHCFIISAQSSSERAAAAPRCIRTRHPCECAAVQVGRCPYRTTAQTHSACNEHIE